ncbi:hypothetical protein BGW36DRAFT_407890 [Talaromyces proteolyticus]|uniref:Integral membrane protein n=1 Tax=Talaromyces proteolyticus TaxID=1131652 RepID=A0AAD4KQF1_9EURO|nr:uncharacterized protein BGW36DRAFT_407890 [Talaromyces proteolyticus]KAH8698002.1 hypothetical protein BGW36DRAFT_407890 [Talaromyces proteolyticus]
MVVSAAFGSGIFASICRIIRLVYSIKLVHSEDFSWNMAPVGLWAIYSYSYAEIATIILAGSIPIIPKFIGWARGQEMSRSQSKIPNPSVNWTRKAFRKGADCVPLSDIGDQTYSGLRQGTSDGVFSECKVLMRVFKSVEMETTFESWPA